MQVQGAAVLLEPSCQVHLCFYSKASSEEEAGVPRAGVMGMRALDQPREPLTMKVTSQPLALVGSTAFPTLAWQHLQECSHCQDRHLQRGELGCKVWPGTAGKGLGLRRGIVRQGRGTSSTELGTRQKN